MNYITNARSMNGIITLTDGVCEIEDGNINTQGNITSSNIYTNDINLNIGNGRSLSVFNDLNNKAYYADIITLSSVIYSNNINVINYELNNNLYNSTLSNLIYNNNNNVINYELNNSLYNSTLSNLIHINNNTYNNSTNQ